MRSRHSLGILFISCFILPVIIILSYLNYQNKENYINGKEDALNKNFSSVEAQLSMLFNEMASTGGSISKSETIKEYLTDPKDEIANLNVSCALDTLVSQNDALNHIAIYDKSGILMPVSTSFVDGDYPNIATESMNYDIDANNGFTNINKYQIKGSRVNFISYICRISDGNTLLGYCVEYYDLSHITKILSNISSTSGFEIMLTDYNGNLIQTSYENIIPYTEHLKYNNVTEAFQNASNNSSTKLTEYNFKYNTGNNLIASQSLSITKNKAGNTWGVIMTTTMEQFMLEYNEIKNDNNRFVIPVFIIFIIAGAIYIFIYTSPINKLNNTLIKYISGDRAARFNSNGKNDVVRIGNTVNRVFSDLEEITELYNLIINMTDNIIFEYNVKKNTVVFSNNFNSKFSFRAKTQKFSDCFFANAVVHRKENLQFQEFISKMLTGVSVQDEFRFKTLYNDYAWYILRCASIKDSEDNITKIVGAMIDIDRAKRREDGLSKKANYDSLTKIFNRVTFELTLLNEIELSQMRKYRIAVLFIDIDDFKFYNNDYGHALGDEVLVFIGETLKELVGHNGFAGRYGGDEFVICYNENPNGLSSGGFAQKIINKLGEGFKSKLIDKHFTVSCSIGIAYSDTTGEIDSIIKDADEAMYNVKKTGKSGYTYYSIPRED